MALYEMNFNNHTSTKWENLIVVTSFQQAQKLIYLLTVSARKFTGSGSAHLSLIFFSSARNILAQSNSSLLNTGCPGANIYVSIGPYR